MGTIVYSNLIELLLEEKDKSEKEILDDAINRFGFSGKNLTGEIKMQLLINEKCGYYKKLDDGKYRLIMNNNCHITGRENFLRILKDAPENYINERPHLKKLKEVLEEKVKIIR